MRATQTHEVQWEIIETVKIKKEQDGHNFEDEKVRVDFIQEKFEELYV